MKKLIGVTGAALLLGLSMTACSQAPASPAPVDTRAVSQSDLSNKPYTTFLTLPNGAQVLCGAVDDSYTGASPANLTCDWTNAQGLNKPALGER